MLNEFITVGTIAKRSGIPVHTCQYILRSRNIEPIGRAGILRVYDSSAVDLVLAEHKKPLSARVIRSGK